MADAVKRPSAEAYQQALDFYRTGASLEQIGERLGLDDAQLEHLEHEGWPETHDAEPLPSLRSQILDRFTRLRAGELDLFAAVAEAGGLTAKERGRTMAAAANIEKAIVFKWARTVQTLMSEPASEIADFALPKSVIESLAALRRLQDPRVDLNFVRVFALGNRKNSGKDGEGDGDSLEDAIMRDLADLDDDELEEYVRTGRKPSRQRELPFTEAR